MGAERDEDWIRVPSARMKFDAEFERWTLYWFDRNSKAHRYEFVEPYRPMRRLIDEIDQDPTCIFWG